MKLAGNGQIREYTGLPIHKYINIETEDFPSDVEDVTDDFRDFIKQMLSCLNKRTP